LPASNQSTAFGSPQKKFQERCFVRLNGIKAEPGGIEEMIRLSTPRAKKVGEELMPLAAYTRFHRGEDLDIRWLGGNQGYDAELRSTNPKLPEHLEVTMAIPENEYLVREFHAEHGYSWTAAGTRRDPPTKKVEPVAVAGDMTDYCRELESMVRVVVAKKLAKTYPIDTSLIVQFQLERCLLRNEFDELGEILRVKPIDPDRKFCEVVLVEPYEYRASNVSLG
jgi:hypothetical protein